MLVAASSVMGSSQRGGPPPTTLFGHKKVQPAGGPGAPKQTKGTLSSILKPICQQVKSCGADNSKVPTQHIESICKAALMCARNWRRRQQETLSAWPWSGRGQYSQRACQHLAHCCTGQAVLYARHLHSPYLDVLHLIAWWSQLLGGWSSVPRTLAITFPGRGSITVWAQQLQLVSGHGGEVEASGKLPLGSLNKRAAGNMSKSSQSLLDCTIQTWRVTHKIWATHWQSLFMIKSRLEMRDT